MSTPTYLPSPTEAKTNKNAALQAELEQTTAKIAELKAEVAKFEEEILRTTKMVLNAIDQRQQKASKQATDDYAQTKQRMLDELFEARKGTFLQLAEANSRFEAAKDKFDTELTTWQKQSSELLQKTEQTFSSQKETKDNPNFYGEDAIKALTNGFRDAVFFNPSAAIDKKVEMDSLMALVDRLIEKVGQPVAEAIVSSKKQR